MELEELANKVLNSDSKQETLSYFDKFIGD